MFGLGRKADIPAAADALKGRETPIPTAETHFVTGRPLKGPYPEHMRKAMFGMGCFWGVERNFWTQPGVWVTAAGYAAGQTPNPTYKEVCSGRTGHNEVVLVVYDPNEIDYEDLLNLFWEGHDPTQGMRQGPDRGAQYRSGIYTFDDEQERLARASVEAAQARLSETGRRQITTEIQPAPEFYFAEDYHQQYIARRQGAAASA